MQTLLGISKIEKAFYDMGKLDTKLQEYFFSYYAQKLILLNHFYPFVREKLVGYTDHGPEHISRIMKLYDKFLQNNISGLLLEDAFSHQALNFYEIYLLLCATVWHDVGNLLGRKSHAKKIGDVVKRVKRNSFVDKDTQKYMLQIAKAHTGDDGVNKKIRYDDTNYKDEEINLRFLGAILRFVDELEEGELRGDRQYYDAMKDQIPEENRIYWETSCCLKRIDIDADNCKINIRARINKEDLFKAFPKTAGMKVCLIDEIIYRVDKMNQERKYYMRFVRKQLEYREILFDLTVENSEIDKITFVFNNDQGYNEFWRNYPKINPGDSIDGYILQKGVET